MRRQGYLKKIIMLGKMEGSKKRGSQIIIDTIEEAIGMSLQKLSRSVWTLLILRVTRSQSQFSGM